MNQTYEGPEKNYQLLSELEASNTRVDKGSQLEYNVDGCSCMSCGCFKSAWTMVLAPVGVAAGLAAAAADAALELGSSF